MSSYNKETKILKKGLQTELVANNTVMPDELEKMIKEHEKLKDKKKSWYKSKTAFAIAKAALVYLFLLPNRSS